MSIDSTQRIARPRHYLMCRPAHFTVSYQINPWMHPDESVDTPLAVQQWDSLHQTFLDLGHTVDLIEPVDGLPDMVYAANGGLVIDGIAWGANFVYPERQPEGPLYMDWFRSAGFDVREPVLINEGEGDFLLVGRTLFAGTGFRSDLRSHHEAQEIFGVPVISLELVDPHYYHLDTALAVLDDENIAYYPPAFSPASQAVLRQLYPNAILATENDARWFGLNMVSDGYNVCVAENATEMQVSLKELGYNPIPLDLTVLLAGGGGIKCCTLELRS